MTAAAPAGSASRLRHLWDLPIWAHAVGLGVVLTALLAVIGTDVSYSADEGAAIIEARSLHRGDGWVIEHPLPEVDPEGVFYPLDPADWGEEGVAAFAKHPLYPVLLRLVAPVGGVTAMVALSLLGTVCAALAAAHLSRLARPGLERPTLWVVGLGSPLFFDSFWVVAHSLAAALMGGSALLVLHPRAGPSARAAAAAAVGMGLAVLLRTEASIMVVALVLTLGGFGLAQRSWRWIRGGALVAVVGAITYVGERAIFEAILGERIPEPAGRLANPASSGDVWADGWDGFVRTWLQPGTNPEGIGRSLLVLGALLGLAACYLLLRRSADVQAIRVLAVGAATVVALRPLVDDPDQVTGLLLAFPMLWVGLVVGLPGALATRQARLLAAVASLYALGVLATQYARGGGGEWGGRYFHLMLPLAVPLALAGLAWRAERLDRMSRRIGGVALGAVTAAMSALAVMQLHGVHDTTRDNLRRIEAAVDRADSPVVVTNVIRYPRLAWRTFDEQQWLLAGPVHDELPQRLRRHGVEAFTLVTSDLDRFLEAWEGDVRAVDDGRGEAAGVHVLRITGA